MGVSAQAFGTLNHWLIQLINIVTGNLDRVGGSLFTQPAVNDFAETRPGRFARFSSRVSGKPEFGGELPVSVLAEECLTPGEGQIKALFTCAGNPVLSTPNGRQLDRALAGLDFMVSLDPYLNETTRHADIILPPTAPLEHDHYDLAFHTHVGTQHRAFQRGRFPPSPTARGMIGRSLPNSATVSRPCSVTKRGLSGRRPNSLTTCSRPGTTARAVATERR